ncbi:MAG TPA: molybdenum cofactor biosynthesis protein MoaE [Vicinamibacterales bacterium]|nr:molybdenum cofactor biosynthesis protein MoaE [Vicinamibacterales bacterium]
MRFAISAAPLDVHTVIREVWRADCGAVATFIGTTRDHHAGRRVLYLEYEAYVALAIRAFELIDAETRQQWPDAMLAIHHRIGRVDIGAPSVVIAAASPHRAEAFAAARYAIERLKQIAPIWKRERFEGGEQWVEGASADPDDAAARQMAFERACR